MIKVVALFGKSGAGKDTILNLMLKSAPGVFNKIVSCTTRPPRNGEVDGVDYHFITREEFAAGVMKDEFIEALEFNGWFYGAQITSLNREKINIGIFTPSGINALMDTSEEFDLAVLPIYIRCNDIERIFRCLEREISPDIKEIHRRYYTDEADFKKIQYGFETIYNEKNKNDLHDNVEIIADYCKDMFG